MEGAWTPPLRQTWSHACSLGNGKIGDCESQAVSHIAGKVSQELGYGFYHVFPISSSLQARERKLPWEYVLGTKLDCSK